MAIGAIIKQGVSKLANKAKDGIKNKLANKAEDEVKKKVKKVIMIKVGIPVGITIILVAAISIILKDIFHTSSASIEATTTQFKDELASGNFQGDKGQIQFALDLDDKYSSFIGFNEEQISKFANDAINAYKEKNNDAYEAVTSKYGSLSEKQKSEIVDLNNEILNDSNIDKNNLNSYQSDVTNFYKYSKEGNYVGAISIYDNVSLYEHILRTEKYNFNNINWQAYTHSSSSPTPLKADGLTYDSTMQLIYPTAGGVKVKDLVNMVSPYLLSSRIPLAFLSSATYSSNSSESIGTSVVDNYWNEQQGKNNNIGDLAYEIIKHGQSDITINQYNLESRTTSSYWLDYDIKQCKDTYKIKEKVVTTKNVDSEGKVTTNVRTTYSYVPDSYSDGTTANSSVTGHNNSRWNENKEEVNNNETRVGNPVYSVSIQYKLANALSFDVKVNNSFEYKKYSDDDADKLEGDFVTINSGESEYKEVTKDTEGNHVTLDQINNWSSEQINSNTSDKRNNRVYINGESSAESSPNYYDNNDHSKGYSTVKTDVYEYDVTGNEYTYYDGKRYDITRMWSDSISAEPSSTSKVLLSLTDVINYNKNSKSDSSMSTVSEQDFKADQNSVDYYKKLAEEEDTKINTIDMLNSNPKIMFNYMASSQAYSKYVGLSRGNYTISQGINIIKEYFQGIADENNTLPFVYGASLGFETNASAPSSLSGTSSKALLKEFIHAWESGGQEPKSNGDKYIVEDDGAGHPTVGYGIDIYNSGFLSKFVEAGYGTTMGSEIDKEFVDGLEDLEIEIKTKVVDANTQGLNLTEYQKHALISRAYNGWPNAGRFKSDYLQYWVQERDDKYGGEPDFTHGLYVNHMSTPITSAGKVLQGLIYRRESEWRLFQTGHYYRAGIIDKWWTESAGGDILEAAEAVHKVMEDESWSYYTDAGAGNLYWNNIEKSLNNSTHATCCATFVGAALYYGGIFTEQEMNSFNYNACGSSFDFYAAHGDVITSYDELEAGDIVFFDYGHDGGLDHVEIYAGDDTWYGAGSTNSIRRDSPYKGGGYWKSPFAKAVRLNV